MRVIPQLDTYPRLVMIGQTALGKVALLVLFAAGNWANGVSAWAELTVAVALVAYFPARRRLLVSMATLYWLMFHSNSSWLNLKFLRAAAETAGQRTDWLLTVLAYGLLGIVFAVLAFFFRHVRARSGSFASRRPVLCLLFVFSLMVVVADAAPVGGNLRFLAWGVVSVSSPFLWYAAYALKDAATKTTDGVILQFGTLFPFWGGTAVPYAKGAANLRKIEIRDPDELSRTQLKAIKLLIWSFVLGKLHFALQVLVYVAPPSSRTLHMIGIGPSNIPNLGIPELSSALHYAGILPAHIAWLSLIAHFMGALLSRTVYGATVIAACRMAGFYALRNTYRPLEARTVADFWNRYYYYFKELLVEFFFFPTFTRYFRKNRRIRLFVATMAAATCGNLICNFLLDFAHVAQMGLWLTLVRFQTYMLYAIILGIGIGVSQLRQHSRWRLADGAPWWRRRISTLGVLLFFCLLEIFDHEDGSVGLADCWKFILNLLRIPVRGVPSDGQ